MTQDDELNPLEDEAAEFARSVDTRPCQKQRELARFTAENMDFREESRLFHHMHI